MKPKAIIQTIKAAIANRFSLLIKGSPGIGKSEVVAQACREVGIPLIIRHPVIEESIDYKGLPGFADGVAKFFPFADFHALLCADKPLAVFFDDLGQAPASVQAALMQVIQAREIGGKKISEHVRFVAATNSRKDSAGVSAFISPLVSRFTVIEMEPELNDWIQWALTAGMPLELVAFLRFRPDLLSTFDPAKQKDITPYACPRSIATLGRWMNAGATDLELWQGAVGEAFAVEFYAFYKTFKSIGTLPDKIILSPQTAEIPIDPSVIFALCGALAHRANRGNFAAIAQYANRLPAEYAHALIIDATRRHPELLESAEYIRFVSRRADQI